MAESPDLRERLRMPRSTIPAVTHVDFSARVQTVDERRHGRYYRLLKTFYRDTGCPVRRQHQLQRARRTDRLHAETRIAASSRPRWTRSCSKTSSS